MRNWARSRVGNIARMLLDPPTANFGVMWKLLSELNHWLLAYPNYVPISGDQLTAAKCREMIEANIRKAEKSPGLQNKMLIQYLGLIGKSIATPDDADDKVVSSEELTEALSKE